MNLNREKTVNTKTTHAGYGPTGPTVNEIRISRLSHPRATLVAMVLLATVFLLFGMFANAIEVTHAAAPNTIEGAAVLISDWVFGCSSVATG